MCGYFLIVWDIMEFARKNGILSQGRGSAASSLVAYLLGITPVDPHQARPLRRQVPERILGCSRHRHRYRHPAAGGGDPVCLREVRRGACGDGLHLRDVPGTERRTGGGEGIRLPPSSP